MGTIEIKEKIRTISNFISNFKIYFFLGIPLVGIIFLLILFQFVFSKPQPPVTNVTTSETKSSPSNVPLGGYGSIDVRSPVNGAEFLLNNTLYYAPTTIQKLTVGTYTLTAHNEGYKDESYTIQIQDHKLTKVSLTMEKASTESAIDQDEKTWVGSMQEQTAQTNQNIQTLQTKNPLTQYLPQPMGAIMFDYNINSDGSVQYVVYPLQNQTYSKSDYEQQINDFIQSKGIDPNTITVQWQ